MTTSAADQLPAEAFPPGEYLADELAERGWSIAEFAAIIGRPVQAVSEIVNGRKEITAETAAEIAAATGTNAETWLRLQSTYRLWRLQHDGGSSQRLSDVQRRSRLAGLVPMRELVKRRLVPPHDVDAQERAVCDLLGIPTLDTPPAFAAAARRADAAGPPSPVQVAWLALVRRAAANLSVRSFDREAFRQLAADLTHQLREPSKFATLPTMFAAVGVRLVYVAPFPRSKIDGAAYVEPHSPVIGISARRPHFDSILFTLLHEAAHIELGHRGYTVDYDLGAPSETTTEAEADQTAAAWALPEQLPLTAPYSRAKVLAAADALEVHPAVIVGRLHHDGLLPWSHLNNLVPNVRAYVQRWNG